MNARLHRIALARSVSVCVALQTRVPGMAYANRHLHLPRENVDRRPWEADVVLIILNNRCGPTDEKLTCSSIVRIQVHTFLFLVKTDKRRPAIQEAGWLLSTWSDR